MHQAFRALGRLLLAEPEAALAPLRERLRTEHGAGAGLVAALLPEFGPLLGAPPDLRAADALDAARLQQAALCVMAMVASRERPLVLFIDDLQWAGITPPAMLDALLGDERLQACCWWAPIAWRKWMRRICSRRCWRAGSASSRRPPC